MICVYNGEMFIHHIDSRPIAVKFFTLHVLDSRTLHTHTYDKFTEARNSIKKRQQQQQKKHKRKTCLDEI